MRISDIREARHATVSEMRGLLNLAESEKRQLTPAEQQRFDTMKASIEAGEAAEARLSFLEDAERRMVGRPASDAVGRDMVGLERRVSLLEVMRARMEGEPLTGAAAEFHAETERRTGRKAKGVYVPMSLFETRATTKTTDVSEIVPTDHRPQDYILPLRNALLARKLGVRVLSGLVGNPSIPRTAAGLSVGWVAQDAALSASNLDTDAVTLAPKHVGGVTELSRQLIQQSSPDIEALVREDFAFAVAKAIDAGILCGPGTGNAPTGVIATSGIQTSALATLNWANIHTLLQKLDLENSPAANIVASTKVKAKVATTLKVTSDAGAGFLLDGNVIAGVPAYFINQMAEKSGSPNTGRLVAGDFSQVLLGIWSELDLLVNPFAETPFGKGNVLVRIMATVDVAVRQPKAFVLADDVAI